MILTPQGHALSDRRKVAGCTGSHDFQAMPRIVKTMAAAAPSAPYGNRKMIAAVLNQGARGTCETNGCGQAVRVEQIRELVQAMMVLTARSFDDCLAVVMQAPPELLSRMLLYWAATSIDGNPGQDVGTYSETIFRALTTYGYMPESKWPYSDTASLDPGAALVAYERLCFDQRLPAYARIDSDSMTVAQANAAISSALAARYVVSHASAVTAGFENLRPGELWVGPDDGTPVLGGHDYVIVDEGPASALCSAAVSNEDAYLGLNSWGPWCDRGFFLMKKSAVANRYDDYIASRTAPYSGTN